MSCMYIMYRESDHFSRTPQVKSLLQNPLNPPTLTMILKVPWGQCGYTLYYTSMISWSYWVFIFWKSFWEILCFIPEPDIWSLMRNVSRLMHKHSWEQRTQPESSKWLGFTAVWPLTLPSTTWRLWWTGKSWRTKLFQFLQENNLLLIWLRSCSFSLANF